MSKPRPTDAEFDELKRKRDESIRATVLEVCKEHGWDPAETAFHASGAGECYCACPEGPCQHIWNGPNIDIGNGFSVSCSRCGTSAFSHTMRYAP